MAKIRIRAMQREISWRRSLAAFLGLFMLSGLAGSAAEDSSEIVKFDLVLQGYELSGAENVVRVHQGDRVEIRWSTDAPATVHLHGYDIELQLSLGGAGLMAFEANATGRFPIELHGGHEQGDAHHGGALMHLEVHPR